jgi:spermidine synthase
VAGGLELILRERDGEFVLWAGGYELMSSRVHGSEVALARIGCAHLPPGPRVLVGGLGMGFTLRAALDLMPEDGSVTVAEISPEVIEWNRGDLARLARQPLSDPRVEARAADVRQVLAEECDAWDSILLDVDNGPESVLIDANDGLYGRQGLDSAHSALRPGGVLAVWSAWADRQFTRRLREAGFQAEARHVRLREGQGGTRATIFVARKPAA